MFHPDSRLNHYRILRPLGSGGMGEVYEAEDTRLKRRVALKVLTAETESDPARRARFVHEAQAIAALNHPNIVTIHSVEECGDTRFLTMEVVDGCTIDKLLPSTGFTLQEVLKYALPLVDAVAAAHERGIVHRDLKPANVMVTGDGRVKVLDFGVAKLAGRAVAVEASATTFTAVPATTVGQIVGTVSYMSPEQAQGRPIDHRSDLFSLGILLYELATGVRPFNGDTRTSILASIISDEPAPMTTRRPAVSQRLEGIVRECLAKDPAMRPQSAKQLHDRLQALAASEPGRGTWKSRATMAAAALALLAAAYAATSWTRGDSAANPGTASFSRITDNRGLETWPGFSPDGSEIVYVGDFAPGRTHIYLRRLDGAGDTIDLSRSNGSDSTPTFSPDGRWIAFGSTRDGSAGIFVMTRSGDSVRRLTNGGFDPSWTPDGKELVFSTQPGRDPDAREAPGELWAVNVDSGQQRRISGPDAVQPRVSPNGRFVAFWALAVDASGKQFANPDRDIWLQPLAGGARVWIAGGDSTEWNAAWSPDSRFLYFSSDRAGTRNIWRVAVDPETGRPSDPPLAITVPASYVSDMSVSTNGIVAYTAFEYETIVRGIAFDPMKGAVSGISRDVVADHHVWLHPDVSPDGRFLTMRSYRGREDVWIVGVDGAGLRNVTNDTARDRGARFARDGSILFYSSRSGNYQFWSIRPDGSGARQLTHAELALNYPLPSPDGRWVAGTNPNANEQFIFDTRDWAKAPERLPAPPVKAQVYLRDWAPSSTRLAAADLSGGLWVFDLTERSWERVGSGAYPRWLPDGRRLLAADCAGGRITIVDTVTKAASDVYREPGRCIGAVALAPDGRQLYFTSGRSQADIWTMRFSR